MDEAAVAESSPTKTTSILADSFWSTSELTELQERQESNSTIASREVEGSGEENDFDSTTNATVITAVSSTNRASRQTRETATTPPITTTGPNPTRGRRTIAESDYNKIVDLDVSTPQLKILEEGFDLLAKKWQCFIIIRPS
ncbi:unnamed protein product [Gongylonema pulchrum]|uniref:Uncharacterized protein n=1 Tax=Gongylonema pulchrum TaxID=637853 RepID=A0A3P7RKJ2_9BILA|nr:unnamed protein product [Gongylonema pulchrum]